MLLAFLTITLAFCAAGRDQAFGSFGATTNFTAGGSPSATAAGDLDGDGFQDLAVANTGTNNLSVLLGSGTGSFGPPTNFVTGPNPADIAVANLNGDGFPDLVTANFSGNNVSILLNSGTGSFGAATTLAVDGAAGNGPSEVAVGDLNGDGFLDLSTANGGGANTVSILLGTGTGTFGAAANFATGTRPDSVDIGNINGDGFLDLAVSNRDTNNVSILLGTGTGFFGAATNFGVGSAPSSVAIGDLNGDGFSDLVASNELSSSVSVLLGNGTGSFGAASSFPAGFNSFPSYVTISDLDGDNVPDLAIALRLGNKVAVLIGNGAGSFGAPAQLLPTGTAPDSVMTSDLNGDNLPDLTTSNFDSANVSVMLNQLPVLAEQVVVKPVTGTVKVKCPGDDGFSRLKATTDIPVGCLIDTRKGLVRLNSAGKDGRVQSAVFWKGLFRVTQRAGKNPTTDLTLKGPLNCPKPKASPRARVLNPVTQLAGRGLWGKGKGNFKTKGKRGSASVRGTTWLVKDRCNRSTLFKVAAGVVEVRDFVKKRTLKLRKGKTYVARARRSR